MKNKTPPNRQAPKKTGRRQRAPEPTAEPRPTKKDDPSRDKAEIKDGVLQPLPHAD